jgi:hypothetical protein
LHPLNTTPPTPERYHLYAALVVHDAVAIIFLHGDRDARSAETLVSHPDSDVVGIGLPQVRHQRLGSALTGDPQRRWTGAEMRFQPAGQPYVGHADSMVGVKMSEQ